MADDDHDDHDDLFTPALASGEQRERARAKGWPDDLLDRMLALRYPSWKVELALSADGFPTLEMFETEIAGRERLTQGLCVREATWEDDERLSDLFANADERVGEWTVTVERSPNPFAQQRLQENWNVKLLVDRGVALGANAQSGRSSLVAGRQLSVAWMGGWRVRNGFRRLGYSNLLMNTPGSAAGVFGMVTYWYVRLENGVARSWISHAVTDTQASSGRAMDKQTVSVHHFPAERADNVLASAAPFGRVRHDGRVRLARPDDLARCVELINRTHDGLDLFRPYSVELLRSRLDDLFWGPKPPFVATVYGWPDMAVLEDGGEIVACGGLWDRGRDVRERWRHRESGDERLVEETCLMDFGYADGRADAMAALIGHHLVTTRELGRTGLCAPLEFAPDVLAALACAEPEVETRALETMGFHGTESHSSASHSSEGQTDEPLHIDGTIARPYTDLAYW